MSRDKTIGLWRTEYGWLSNPIGFVDGKPVRMRVVRNRYASKEHNRPTYIAFIDEKFDIVNEIKAEIEENETTTVDYHYHGYVLGCGGELYSYNCAECDYEFTDEERNSFNYCPICGKKIEKAE